MKILDEHERALITLSNSGFGWIKSPVGQEINTIDGLKEQIGEFLVYLGEESNALSITPVRAPNTFSPPGGGFKTGLLIVDIEHGNRLSGFSACLEILNFKILQVSDWITVNDWQDEIELFTENYRKIEELYGIVK